MDTNSAVKYSFWEYCFNLKGSIKDFEWIIMCMWCCDHESHSNLILPDPGILLTTMHSHPSDNQGGYYGYHTIAWIVPSIS